MDIARGWWNKTSAVVVGMGLVVVVGNQFTLFVCVSPSLLLHLENVQLLVDPLITKHLRRYLKLEQSKPVGKRNPVNFGSSFKCVPRDESELHCKTS